MKPQTTTADELYQAKRLSKIFQLLGVFDALAGIALAVAYYIVFAGRGAEATVWLAACGFIAAAGIALWALGRFKYGRQSIKGMAGAPTPRKA